MNLKRGLLRLAIGATIVAAIVGFIIGAGVTSTGSNKVYELLLHGLLVAGILGGLTFLLLMLIRWIVLGFKKDE
jgi:hypothetical protein